MSKSIWHTPDEIPEEDRVIVVKSKRTGEYLVGSEFEFVLDNFTKWAYFDDLLALETELERTRKALDVAVDALKTVRRYTAINQFAPKSREAHIVAKKAVAEITALEQKD